MGNTDLTDQLKYHKVVRKITGFTVTQKSRMAFVLQLQSLLSDWHADANDLEEGDAGIEGRGIKRKARAPAGGGSNGKKGGRGKKKKQAVHYAVDEEGNEVEWEDGEEYEVEAIVGTRVSVGPRADKTERYAKGTKLYRVVWQGFATDEATWEPAENLRPDLLAEYEAELDAAAELDTEEERALAEDEEAEEDE